MNLINGDSQEELKKMSADSIDAVVCDPPYGLSSITTQQFNECMLKWCTDDRSFMPRSTGFMGKSWDGFVPPPALWDEVYRVLKPGAHALIFAGSRTQDLMGLSLRLAGFEVRDTIQWLYGSGFPKSHDISKAIDKFKKQTRKVIHVEKSYNEPSGLVKVNQGKRVLIERKITAPSSEEAKQYEGYGTALKPAFEPAILCRKPLDGTVANNVLKHGVGGLNIDGCRIDTDDDLMRTNKPDQFLTWGGTYGKGQNTSTLRHELGLPPLGRWPSNVIMDEQVECGEWKRFFYCAKASREEREQGLDGFELKKAGCMKGEETRENKPSNHPLRKNIHPTVKPIDLMKYLCRLITPPNGTVLDPFMGSGSTGIAAIKEGFNFIGIEREQQYFKIAESRINYWIWIELTYESNEEKPTDSQLSLFG